jgi:outer membrane lipoprotein-sorting protein
MRRSLYAAALAATLISVPVAHAAKDDAKSILDKVSKNVDAKDEVATVKMVITEADGASKSRELEIRRKGKDDSQKVLVKLNGPADLKGTAFLSVSKGKSNDQWIFFPSSKQTRRIQGGKQRGGSFMDSELSYEDMGTSSDAQYVSKVAGKKKEGGRDFTLVENTPKGESTYGKTVIWVDDKLNLVGKIEYFDKSGKPLKVSVFSKYKQYGPIWRAQKVEVKNSQTKRGTVLELSDLKINKGLEDGEFTESALTEGD